MNDRVRRDIDDLAAEGEALEARWRSRDERPPAGHAALLTDIRSFLETCAWNGRFMAPGSTDRRAMRSMFDRWAARLGDAGADVDALPPLADYDPAAGVVLVAPCPYPGLDAYRADQRTGFFGRDKEIEEAVRHLDAAGNRILLIFGSSGCGKSSLALAGVVPRLKDLHGDAWWFGPAFSPGARPTAALARCVARAVGRPEAADALQRQLVDAPAGAHAAVAAVAAGRQALLLVIDQFEELLTLCRDAGEQERFASILCALSDPSGPVDGFVTRILLTLRTDHLDRFGHTDELMPLHRRLIGEDNNQQLSAIGFAGIRRAIKDPADRVGLRFVPPELIDRLASETAGLANGLPLLQFALQRLWETRPGSAIGQPLDMIDQAAVAALPDVQRALGNVAQGLFKDFEPQQKALCERLLQELVVLDDSFEEPLRRRRREDEVRAVLERAGYVDRDIGHVIGTFVDHRLLRRFGEAPESRLEVSHEALLRHWDHIHKLMSGQGVKERLHLVKQVAREAAGWHDRGRQDDELALRGDRLDDAAAAVADGWIVDTLATDYVAACRRLAEDERRRIEEAEQAVKRAEIAEDARKAAKLRYTRAALVALAALLLLVGWRLWVFSEDSYAQTLAMAAEGEVDREPQRALLLALEGTAHGTSRGGELEPGTERALRAALRGNAVSAIVKGYGRTQIKTAALSPDATLLAAGDSVGGVILWDVARRAQRRALFMHVGPVNAIAFSADGRRMASGGADGRVVIWDVAQGVVHQVLTAHLDEVTGLAFSRPDGALLASGGADGALRLWDAASGAALKTLHGHIGGIRSLAFGRDASQLASAGDDGRVVVWEARAGRPVYALAAPGAADIDLAADGSRLAIAAGAEVSIWDPATRARLLVVRGHSNGVTRVRFSADRRLLASTGYDASVRVWRLPAAPAGTRASAELLVRLTADNTLGFEGLAFSPVGDLVAAVSREGSATLWNVATGGERFAAIAHDAPVRAVAFNPQGQMLVAAGGGDGRVTRWSLGAEHPVDVVAEEASVFAGTVAYAPGGTLAYGLGADVVVLPSGAGLPLRLRGHKSSVLDLAFSPDSRRLVSAGDDRAIVWDLASGKPVVTFTGHSRAVTAVAYSPDGRLIATGGRDNTIRLWAADSGRPSEPQLDDGNGHGETILDLAFSADGKLLISGSVDKTVRVWTLAGGTPPRVLKGHLDVVNAVATTGSLLATASDDGIRLWNLRTLAPLSAFAATDQGARSLAFSADGRYLVAGSRDGGVRVYAMHDRELVRLASDRVRRGWTADECEQYGQRRGWQAGPACPRTSYELLDEAQAKLERFEFEDGEKLLRQAKAGRVDAAELDAEVDARLATAMLWAASSMVEQPEQWSMTGRDQMPARVRSLLDAVRGRSKDLVLDPERRLRDLLAWEDVKRARDLAREGLIDESAAAFENARKAGWSLPAEPGPGARRLAARDAVAAAWQALQQAPETLPAAGLDAHLAAVEQAVAQEAEVGPAHRVLGLLYARRGDLKRTEAAFRDAARIESSLEPLVWLAQSLTVGGLHAKAADYARQAIAADAALDGAWLQLGAASAIGRRRRTPSTRFRRRRKSSPTR